MSTWCSKNENTCSWLALTAWSKAQSPFPARLRCSTAPAGRSGVLRNNRSHRRGAIGKTVPELRRRRAVSASGNLGVGHRRRLGDQASEFVARQTRSAVVGADRDWLQIVQQLRHVLPLRRPASARLRRQRGVLLGPAGKGWNGRHLKCRHSAIRQPSTPQNKPTCGITWCTLSSANATTLSIRQSGDSPCLRTDTLLIDPSALMTKFHRTSVAALNTLNSRPRLSRNSGSGADGSMVMAKHTHILSPPTYRRVYATRWPRWYFKVL